MGNGLNEPGEILEGHVFSKLTGLPPLCYRPVALIFAILNLILQSTKCRFFEKKS